MLGNAKEVITSLYLQLLNFYNYYEYLECEYRINKESCLDLNQN